MRRLPLAASTLALLLLGQAALARPGGGGGYSGGGSRGGSSGGARSSGGSSSTATSSGGSRSTAGGGSGGAGSDVDSFDSTRGSIRSTPGDARVVGKWFALLFIPTAAFLVGGLVVRLSVRRKDEDDDGTHRLPDPEPADEPARVGPPPSLDALVARDPALTFASIEARVHRMNEILRAAWCAGDMRPARPFVSDGVYSRFQVQLALMKGEGRRNVMKDAQLLDVELEEVGASPPLDVVHVRITARARDTEVPWEANERAVDHALEAAPIERYEEIWSLVRRQGATTSRDASGVGRECRSCGAPLIAAHAGGSQADDERIRCRYCGSLLCSGEHDWVLAEITQVSEWHPMVKGASVLDALRARDPELTREAIEDRAAFLFWKWIEAGRMRSPAPLRKHATPVLLATRAHLEGLADARAVAVGAVDLLSAEEGALDCAHVRVSWSAKHGASASADPARSVLRLVRNRGARTRASMTALACGNCGAPVGEADTPACDHCGALLANGDHAWVLDAIER